MLAEKQVHDSHMKEMRSKVFRHMLKTRAWKYRAFLIQLRLFKYLAFSPLRGRILESYYTLMRYLDDIVDGDSPLPEAYSDEAEFMSSKIHFLRNPNHPKDEADYLILYCFEQAAKIDETFIEESEDIMFSLLFDAKRKGSLTIFPKADLIHHFHKMDIRGTIRATLKIFKEDPEKYLLLEPLGLASRYQFDLEDFQADIKAGYVNISIEECKRFGITPNDLLDADSPKVKKWCLQRAKDGLDLLKEHHRLLPKGNFSWISKLAFSVVYEYPARKVFLKIIAESNNEMEDEERSI